MECFSWATSVLTEFKASTQAKVPEKMGGWGGNGFPELLYFHIEINLRLLPQNEETWMINLKMKYKCTTSPYLFLQKSLIYDRVTWEKFLHEQNTSGTESEVGKTVSGIASVIKKRS